jgi:hypothetical protein
MSHPLTDEIIRYDKKLGCQDFGTWLYTEEDLRATADWQLEQVKEWLRNNLRFGGYLTPVRYADVDEIDVDEVIEDLQKAMRPTTT